MCMDYRGVKPPPPYRPLREHRETLWVRGHRSGLPAGRAALGHGPAPSSSGRRGGGPGRTLLTRSVGAGGCPSSTLSLPCPTPLTPSDLPMSGRPRARGPYERRGAGPGPLIPSRTASQAQAAGPHPAAPPTPRRRCPGHPREGRPADVPMPEEAERLPGLDDGRPCPLRLTGRRPRAIGRAHTRPCAQVYRHWLEGTAMPSDGATDSKGLRLPVQGAARSPGPPVPRSSTTWPTSPRQSPVRACTPYV